MTSISQSNQASSGKEHLDKLVEEFKTNGYIILEDILPKELVNELYSEYMKALNEKVTRFGLERVKPTDNRDKYNNNVGIEFKPEGGNHDLNRWNMHLPSKFPLIESLVIANPQLMPVLDTILGEDCFLYMIASDTPFPGSGFQNFHQDDHRMALTVNIPLVDFAEDNAPLEVLPGTHRKPELDNTTSYTKEDVGLSEEQLKNAVNTISSKRLLVRAGSIIIRDQRLIHRGTAHYGQAPRPALSLWYKTRGKFNISNRDIPIPHRFVCNLVAKLALDMRKKGRGNGSRIQDQKLVNIGNLLGRIIDEISGTDRDYRRVIPIDIWESLTPDAKRLLRYAEVQNNPKTGLETKRSIFGTLIVLGIAVVALGIQLKLIPATIFQKKNTNVVKL